MIQQLHYVKTALRLPPTLHAALHQAAKLQERSFNAEILSRLRSTFDATRTQQPAAPKGTP